MYIPVSHGHLEARLDEPEQNPAAAAVLCHPHPQYGGTMHTKALFVLSKALNQLGVATLRFNFRGVNKSTGSFDGGEGEHDDVRAALDWLREQYSESRSIVAGFSFGAVVGLRVASEDERVSGMIGMALPVSLYDFSFLNGETRPLLILQGRQDPLGSLEDVRGQIGEGTDRRTLVEIPGASHLFQGAFDDLTSAVERFFTAAPGHKLVREAS